MGKVRHKINSSVERYSWMFWHKFNTSVKITDGLIKLIQGICAIYLQWFLTHLSPNLEIEKHTYLLWLLELTFSLFYHQKASEYEHTKIPTTSLLQSQTTDEPKVSTPKFHDCKQVSSPKEFQDWYASNHLKRILKHLCFLYEYKD